MATNNQGNGFKACKVETATGVQGGQPMAIFKIKGRSLHRQKEENALTAWMIYLLVFVVACLLSIN